MTDDLHARLESEFEHHRIVRLLHDVPPHVVYEIRVEGRRAVYKADTGPTGSAGTEGAVVAFVDDHTSVPVPEILHVGDEYFVAAWHPAAPAPNEDRPADETWAIATGAGLATLHNQTDPLLDDYGAFRAGADGLTIEGHPDWHASALDYVRRRQPVLAQYDHADVAEDVIEYLETHPDAFAGTDGAVCCHGWATPEHATVADGQLTCLLDFEHAIAAPGEFDYWRTAFPAFVATDNHSAHDAFREGYELRRELPENFAQRNPLYALLNGVYYFESLYVQDQHGPRETAERAERLRERIDERLEELA